MTRIWVVRTVRALEELLSAGRLRGRSEYVWKEHLAPYTWMTRQMAERRGAPPAEDTFPVWAWYQYDGVRRRRPDLRSSAHIERGARGVRIELEVEESEMLLSDFDTWHHVLLHSYLPVSEEDDERFAAAAEPFERKGKLYPRPLRREVRKSWELIFDLDFEDPYVASPKDEKSIQACLWEIRAEQIVSVDCFTAR